VFHNQVFGSCTALTSTFGFMDFVSETSFCTGSSGTSDSGDVGSLTGQQLIWVMIAVLFGFSLLFALMFTFICPTCIKTGYGGEATPRQSISK
jgi:hypothetical protein